MKARRSAPSPASIVYLLGYPGVGKYTVGRELAGRTGALLVDNQVINLPILALFNWDGKGELPPGTLDRAAPIRDAVLTALEETAPPTTSYVFTNVLYDEPESIAVYERLERAARHRGSLFLPVILTCSKEVQLRRVASEERIRRFKISDPAGVERMMATSVLYEPDDPALLRIDTTLIAPEQTASLIIEALQQLGGSPTL